MKAKIKGSYPNFVAEVWYPAMNYMKMGSDGRPYGTGQTPSGYRTYPILYEYEQLYILNNNLTEVKGNILDTFKDLKHRIEGISHFQIEDTIKEKMDIAIAKENEDIGDIKDKFVSKTNSFREQKNISISPAQAAGGAALAYHRGKQAGAEEEQLRIGLLLMHDYPEAYKLLLDNIKQNLQK